MPNPKPTLWRTDRNGNKLFVEVNTAVDARDIEGFAGYPWIIMAANSQLSNAQIESYLSLCGIDGVARSGSWIQRRRWMFRRVPEGNTKGPSRDADGNEARAILFIRADPKMSAPKLSYLLKKEYGIKRSPTWIRKHRVGPNTNTNS